MELDEKNEKRNQPVRLNSNGSQRSSSAAGDKKQKKPKTEKKKHVFALEYVDIVYDFEKEILMHSTDFSKTNINSFYKD